MRFGSKVLFDEVTTTFSVGRRYGLTGPNGAGKSTFMKLLTGESQPQKGSVVRPKKLGVLRQDQFAFDALRVSDTVKFPFNMAYAAARDSDASRYEGLAAAREARALGVQWVFAPVSDVNNNPANPVINIRSYGENPADVSRHVAEFIEGAHSDPKNIVLVSAKHFPGHGDTDVDSHLDLARLNASRDRIEEVELVPFRAAIAHGVDSIMTAHMTVPAIEPEEIPATVSKKVLTGVLREELEFKGLIVTDSMEMKGLKIGRAHV